ncbi:uncharacterized protein Z520_02616 [Fonsecaea multimorphosa CBS 102226]|uniref:Uncharacterized protein n=1 Tax=Fonsecaea multimorphosa CBS 102226 TaxID=1442371 RepID=A0A0D2IZJ5_9EURO|nr:uncharacterized protein Z520_02616 [Fonsecaea multimorphosa CBS 102226]KIY02477.1 hypothetical protein Z520_02616 [Fonsecaea multimorphosa CBS 102226]OAL29116.1 hypothetical protein AYO22_02553 [Fonsecaea multimorphosa]
MAPSTAFRKATKSAFSPPRPGKSKTATKSTKEKKGTTRKSNAARHSSLGGVGNSKIHKQKQRKPRVGRQGPKPKRKGAAAGTMRAILGEASSGDDDEDEDQRGAGSEDNANMDTAVDEDDNLVDEDEGEDDDDDDDDGAQESEDKDSAEEEPSLPPDRTLTLSSPEPDFILAEVTNTSTSSTTLNPPIPLPLIHRIMHTHFSSPNKTSISSDARHLMGKYTEIFVKEAIRRCVDDKRERAAHQNGDGDGVVVGDTGWLEVEDLERVGVQLCLDF